MLPCIPCKHRARKQQQRSAKNNIIAAPHTRIWVLDGLSWPIAHVSLFTVPVSGVAVPYGPGSEGARGGGTETQTAGHSGAGRVFHNKGPDPGTCAQADMYCEDTIDL